jgi:hypothetical protein
MTSSASQTQKPNDQKLDEGSKAAEAWLQLIDEGKYAESWAAASELLRQNMQKLGKGKSFWEKVLRTTRTPLGPLKERRLLTKELTDTVPMAPPGEYIELLYGALHEEKLLEERLVLILEKDSRWRVFSYVARPVGRSQP